MAYFVCTGANGFIGTHIVERLLKILPHELGYEDSSSKRRFSDDGAAFHFDVIGCDLAETLTRSNASRFQRSSRYKFVPHLELQHFLEDQKEAPLAVVHNGACSSTVETDPKVFATLNLEYSQMLWNYCARHSVPYIYASSAGVYGDGKKGFSDKRLDNHIYQPLSLYAKSKHDFDCWALAQKHRPPSWFGLRYFNVYGAFEAHKQGQASMVYHWYQQITRSAKVRLFRSTDAAYSDGGQMRDFVYVKDIVDITFDLIKLGLERKQNKGAHAIEDNGLFVNIGVGKPRTWNDVAFNVFRALGIAANVEYIDMPESLARQYQNYTCADHYGLLELNLAHSFVELEAGIEEYVLKYLTRGL